MDRFNLGSHTRTISTGVARDPALVQLGLNWCFAFNRTEGVKCFRKGARIRPGCVMAHSGIAYGGGPFYNMTWRDHSLEEANSGGQARFEQSGRRARCRTGRLELENRLIETRRPAASRSRMRFRGRNSTAGTTTTPPNCAGSSATPRRPRRRGPAGRGPDRANAATAVEVKTGGLPEGSDVIEALEVCDRAIELVGREGLEAASGDRASVHPCAGNVERAGAGEGDRRIRWRTLCPDAGHLNHMPGHIYMLCGDYAKAKEASEKAIIADDMYLDYAGAVDVLHGRLRP